MVRGPISLAVPSGVAGTAAVGAAKKWPSLGTPPPPQGWEKRLAGACSAAPEVTGMGAVIAFDIHPDPENTN